MPKGKLNERRAPSGRRDPRGLGGDRVHRSTRRPLPGEIHYLKDGSPKRVRYWAMRPVAGEFVPNSEVDQLMWLPPREARLHLSPQRDRDVVNDVDLKVVSTRTCLLVRHGSAGERASWEGDDRERPLDAAR